MDSLTHAALGACLGEIIAGNKIGKKALLLGALVSNIPDIDVVCYLWMSPTEALLAHRGITHSIFFNILISFFLAFTFKKLFKNGWLSFSGWLFFISSGLFIHLFLDLFNAYGTGLFEPFNETRISFNSLFIIDPLFTLPVFISAILLIFLKRSHSGRLKIAKASIFISVLYLIICVVNKRSVNKITEKNISSLAFVPSGYFTNPTPFNNLLWYIVIQDKKQFFIGYYSILDKSSIIHFEKVYKNDSLLFPYRNTADLKNLVRFSQGFYCIDKQDNSVIFNDIRFGQEEGWSKSNATFNFRFDLQRDKKNLLLVQRGRFRSFSRETISGLISRIKDGAQ
jgi:inner membrane protein